MTEPLRIAVLSRWHVHADEYAKAVNDHPDAQVAAVWDENPERGRSGPENSASTSSRTTPTLLARATSTASSSHRRPIGIAS